MFAPENNIYIFENMYYFLSIALIQGDSSPAFKILIENNTCEPQRALAKKVL